MLKASFVAPVKKLEMIRTRNGDFNLITTSTEHDSGYSVASGPERQIMDFIGALANRGIISLMKVEKI